MILYYSHICSCGCNGKIEIKEYHKYYGIPLYIPGHNLTKEKGNYKHGEAIKGKKSKLYRTWSEMISRCTNFKHKRYADNLQINRIENNDNYEPTNCNFVTSQENSQNRRTTKLNKDKVIEIREKYKSGKYTTRQLAKEYNLKSKSTIIFIINNKTWNNI